MIANHPLFLEELERIAALDLPYGEFKGKTPEEIHDIIWNKIKEINKTLPMYKYIKGLTVTDVPLIKTTTNKVKRNEEIRLINGK